MLIFHNPKYAILDECTSGVTREVENKLYQTLQQMQVSYIRRMLRDVCYATSCK